MPSELRPLQSQIRFKRSPEEVGGVDIIHNSIHHISLIHPRVLLCAFGYDIGAFKMFECFLYIWRSGHVSFQDNNIYCIRVTETELIIFQLFAY